MLLDTDLNFVAANRAYEDATDQSEAALVGRNLFDAFPNEGDAATKLRQSIGRVMETGQTDTLAYIEYDIPLPPEKGGGMTKRYWTAIHTPLRDADGNVVLILQNTVDITEIVRLREVASLPSGSFLSGEVALVQRAREAEEANRGREGPLAQFRAIFEEAPGMVALLQGPNHVFTYANKAYRRVVGGRELIGLPVRDVFQNEVDDLLVRLDQTFATGEATLAYESRVMLRDPKDKVLREFFLDFAYHPVVAADGSISGIFVQGYDRTASVQAQRRQQLLLDELNHRVKNTLSTVQSLARRSFRATTDREEARRVFEARILALSNAHNLLSEQHWESADLATIVRLELSALGTERFELRGEAVDLNPKAAIALAMVFHELASNAVKYGALMTSEGTVSLSWRSERDQLRIEWVEQGVRLHDEDDDLKPGFGMRMLERIVTGELEGRLVLNVEGDRLTWTLSIPMTELTRGTEPAHV